MTSTITKRVLFASLLLVINPVGADVVGVVEGVNVPSANISANDAGKVNVIINSADSGVSYNSYAAFNVPIPGLDLDNTNAAATMIINEVVRGGDISSINGQLSILGDRAHVVIANPNGVSVDGGSFFNTANVMLTAAQIHQFQSISGAGVLSGEVTENPFYVVHATDGSVLIGPGGIEGDFPRLDLIAKTVALTGNSDIDGLVNIVGGESTQILYRGSDLDEITDSSTESIARYEFAGNCAGSLDGGSTWDCGELTTGVIDEEGEASYVVDVSGAGTALRAGKISITVNDLGPGFRFAGDSLVAFADDITIRSDGKIEVSAVNGGEIRASGAVEIDNSSSDSEITFNGSELRQAKVTAGLDLVINTGSGSVQNLGYRLESIEIDSESPIASGSVEIISNDFVNRSLSEDALGIVFSSSNKVSSGGFDWDSSDRISAGVIISTAGDIFNDTGRIVSNNGIAFNVGGDFYNRINRISGSNDPIVNTSIGKSGWFLFKKNTIDSNYQYGAVDMEGMLAHVEASAGDIQFNFSNNGKLYNIGGEITANGAQNFIVFDDSGLNLNRSSEDPVDSDSALGSIVLRSGDQALTYSYERDDEQTNREVLLAFIEFVQASRQVDPNLFVDLTSLELIDGSSEMDNESSAVVIGSENASGYALTVEGNRLRSTITKADGSIYIGTPVITENPTAESELPGDDVVSNDESTADSEAAEQLVTGLASSVFNQAVITGQATFSSSCGWLCSQRATSDVVSNGGLISAQNTIEVAMESGGELDWSSVATDLSVMGARVGDYGVTALGYRPDNGLIANIGGRITALNAGGQAYSELPSDQKNAISIRSADGGEGIHVLAKGLTTVDAINRDQGLLGGQYAKLIKQDQGGSFVANQGQIDFAGLLSPVSIKIWGGKIDAANGVTRGDALDLNEGEVLSEDELDPDRIVPTKDSALSSSSLGLTGSLIDSIF